jgi:hypothetical protein
MKQIPIIPLKSQFYLVSVYANGVPGASSVAVATRALLSRAHPYLKHQYNLFVKKYKKPFTFV